MKRDFAFDIGSRVIVLDIEATARVVEAFVNVGNQNEYKVRYFMNGEQRSAIVFEDELKAL
jgi:hypothetical protein